MRDDDTERPWRRSIQPNRSLDPTYAKPPPWFVGGDRRVMLAVLALLGLVLAGRIATSVYLVETWYRWWRAPTPTYLPRNLPPPASPPRALGNVAMWFPRDAYPPSAARTGEQGRVTADLLIDATGVASGCQIMVSSGSRALDAATCRLFVRNGHFAPGRDRGGRPIAARLSMRPVRWQLED